MLLLLLAACAGDKPADTDAAPGDTDTADTGAPPGTVELGETCPLTERIGEVILWSVGADAYLEGKVYDAPDPWIGPAELANADCAFHRFSTDSCGTCDDGEVCGFDGACVPERRVLPVTLDVTTGGTTETYTADAVTGDLYGSVGPADAAYALTLTVDGQALAIPEQRLAGLLDGVVVSAAGDSMVPGDLDATWTVPANAGRVRTVIPINHHAAGPTFTRCDVDATAGGFHADAEMLTPLAVVTGLEFQGLQHTTAAAAWVDAGCIDVRLGTRSYDPITWEE